MPESASAITEPIPLSIRTFLPEARENDASEGDATAAVKRDLRRSAR